MSLYDNQTDQENTVPVQDNTVPVQNTYDYYSNKLDQLDLTQLDPSQIYNEWNKSKKPVLDILQKYYPKPVQEIDPETARKAKGAASITDGVSALAQMFAHGVGARVRNTQAMPTSSQLTNATIKQSDDKYKQAMDRYQTTEGNVAMQDYGRLLQEKQQERGAQRQYYLRQLEQSRKDAIEKARIAREDKKQAIQNDQWKMNYDARNRNDANRIAIENKKLNQQAKSNQQVKSNGNGIVINAHPKDPNAVTDATGNKVIKYNLSKPEIQNIAGAAKQDEKFKNDENYKAAIMVDKTDMLGIPHKGLTSDSELARMYKQWQYDKEQYYQPKPGEFKGEDGKWYKKVITKKTSNPANQMAAPTVQWKVPVLQNAGNKKVDPSKYGGHVVN